MKDDPKALRSYLNSIEDIYEEALRELNLSVEADWARQLAQGAQRYDVAQVLKLHQDVVTRRGEILIYEVAPGVQLSHLQSMMEAYRDGGMAALQANKYYKNYIKENPWLENIESWRDKVPSAYIKAQAEMAMFVSQKGRVCHADPHAGNVFIRRLENGELRPTYIDLGRVVKLTPEQVIANIDQALSLMVGNSYSIAERLVREAESIPYGTSEAQYIKDIKDRLDKALFNEHLSLVDPNNNQVGEIVKTILEDFGIQNSKTQTLFATAQFQVAKTFRDLRKAADMSGKSSVAIEMAPDVLRGLLKALWISPLQTLRVFGKTLGFMINYPEKAFRTMGQFISRPTTPATPLTSQQNASPVPAGA